MAQQSHKRETNARRIPRAGVIAGPLAFLATASVVTAGVLTSNPAVDRVATNSATHTATPSAAADLPSDRHVTVSRSNSRVAVKTLPTRVETTLARVSTLRAVRNAHTKLWTTAPLNIWTAPDKTAKQLGVLAAAEHVLVTARTLYGREEVVLDGKSRWVTKGYLSSEKPLGLGAGLSDAPCPDGSVESGLTSSAVLVYRTVCHAFPQITSYGGWDDHGEHASGRALDIMTSDVTLGTAIADFLQAHAAELDLYDVIWRQQIWTPVRSSEGWRLMPSRGSATADHYDHVHVSTN
ncbi:MAG: hypothetical protein JWO11_986 [Nocardioides sp.]|nr:hypothetical protein [Nocardioides sp.]